MKSILDVRPALVAPALTWGDRVRNLVIGTASGNCRPLTDEGLRCLSVDLRSFSDDEGLCLPEAWRVLMVRIGGRKNLGIYVDCLIAGEKRRRQQEAA